MRDHANGPFSRRSLVLVLLAACVGSRGFAECRMTLPPLSVRELPVATFAGARSVAWRDEQKVLIGTRGQGIVEYDTSTGTTRTIVPGGEVGSGMSDVEKLDTDGTTVVAFNGDRTDIAADLKRGGKLVHTRRVAFMRVMDIAVRDGKVAVLGYSFKTRDGSSGPVWLGDVGASWEDHKLLYDAGEKFDEFFRYTLAPHAGAIRFANRDIVAFILPSEPGVFRYRTDGTPLPKLGRDMTELVTPDLPLIVQKYNVDVAGRYQHVVNRSKTIDDLIILNGEPAVVVRQWAKGTVFWSLWIASDKPTKQLRLGIEDSRATGGHLRCDAHSSKVVCLFGKQTQAGQPDKPNLAMFDVQKAVKQCD